VPPKSTNDKKRIVVCGATGQQGAAVVDAIEQRADLTATVFSRRPTTVMAKALAARGYEIHRADLADRASLERVFAGAHGVFAVTQPWSTDYTRADVEAELSQGRNVVDACREAGVAHLVFSTAMRVDDSLTGVPHVDSKLEIERYVRASGVPWTLLRPGTFMDNIGKSFFPVRRGVVRGFVDGDVRLPFVSCRDIGVAAARVFASPKRWIGEEINLMADHVSGEELCATLGRLRKERFRYTSPPSLLMWAVSPEFFEMRRGFEKAGRPPYPFRKAFDDALDQTRILVGDVWHMERFFEKAGFVTRAF
jgi:uncharacterized protein YbjT (DUF2867 family)